MLFAPLRCGKALRERDAELAQGYKAVRLGLRPEIRWDGPMEGKV